MKPWEMLLLTIETWIEEHKNPSEMKPQDAELSKAEFDEAISILHKKGFLPNYAEKNGIVFIGAELSDSAEKEIDHILEKYKDYFKR